jgi:hypothetical protein
MFVIRYVMIYRKFNTYTTQSGGRYFGTVAKMIARRLSQAAADRAFGTGKARSSVAD